MNSDNNNPHPNDAGEFSFTQNEVNNIADPFPSLV